MDAAPMSIKYFVPGTEIHKSGIIAAKKIYLQYRTQGDGPPWEEHVC